MNTTLSVVAMLGGQDYLRFFIDANNFETRQEEVYLVERFNYLGEYSAEVKTSWYKHNTFAVFINGSCICRYNVRAGETIDEAVAAHVRKRVSEALEVHLP